MPFSSFDFIFIYLPLVLLLYFGMAPYVTRKVQHSFLVLASLFFYAYAHVWYVVLILLSISVNYLSSLCIQNSKKHNIRKTVFIFGVLFNVLLLGYYKYYNFFIDNINDIFATEFVFRKIILPIGISFFTFQQIAFLISVRKKEETVPPPLDYTLFITFFPQLIAGPIVFSQDIMYQYQDDKNRFFNADNFSKGLFLFIIGLFKKVFIADSFSLFTANGYLKELADLSFGGAWVTTISYTLQIYFDFSGYSDMALGLAKMMNINLPVNFYSPYISKSITEFWKRWHITLGRSLAVLIYFPLGGNRKGLPRTCFNLFMVFLVSGIWHGASWTFILWGAMHGVARIFEKLFDRSLERIPTFIRIFITFMFVNVTWVFFRLHTVSDALVVLKKMFLPDQISFEGINKLATDGILSYTPTLQIIYILSFTAVCLTLIFVYKKNSMDLYNKFVPNTKTALFTALLLCVSLAHLSKAVVFIYFNF